jgi:hypothetical protein
MDMMINTFFKKQFLPVHSLSLVGFVYFLACGAQTPQKIDGGLSNRTSIMDTLSKIVLNGQAKDSLPSDKYHTYGEYILERGRLTLPSEEFTRIEIREVGSGILTFTTGFPYSATKIEYYDVTTKNLKKQIDLAQITPYNSQTYKGITVGGINIHDDNYWQADTNCTWPKLPKSDTYRTFNIVHRASKEGFLSVSFILIKLNKSTRDVVGWEQTLMVLNPEGNEIHRMKLDYDTPDPYVLSNGKYLAFCYGGDSGLGLNPFDPCTAVFEIFDLETKKKSFDYNPIKSYSLGVLEPSESLLYSRFYNEKSSIIEQLVADLTKKEVKVYQFIWRKPLLPAKKEYLRFLETLPFQTLKF